MGSEADVWWRGEIGIGGWMGDGKLGVRCVKPLHMYYCLLPVDLHVCKTRWSMRYRYLCRGTI